MNAILEDAARRTIEIQLNTAKYQLENILRLYERRLHLPNSELAVALDIIERELCEIKGQTALVGEQDSNL